MRAAKGALLDRLDAFAFRQRVDDETQFMRTFTPADEADAGIKVWALRRLIRAALVEHFEPMPSGDAFAFSSPRAPPRDGHNPHNSQANKEIRS